MRSYLRFASVIGAVTLGAIAAAPAMAATDNQAGANAVFISIAGNGQGTGNVTASNPTARRPPAGNSQPAFPDPTGQKFITGGVLAQEATGRRPGFSAACAGLAGDGGSVLNIGDSSCLQPGNLVTGSFGSFDPSTLIPDSSSIPADQLPSQAQDLLTQLGNGAAPLTDADRRRAEPGPAAVRRRRPGGQPRRGRGSLHRRRRRPHGHVDADRRLADLQHPGQDPITSSTLPVHPKPNTHVFTNLSEVTERHPRRRATPT